MSCTTFWTTAMGSKWIKLMISDCLLMFEGIHKHFMSKIIHILIFVYCVNLYLLLIVGFIFCTIMFSWPYISIPYLWPLLIVLLFICLPTYLCLNIADHQTCRHLGGLWPKFLQDINVLALHVPNRWKIIIDQIKAKIWKGFWHGQVLIIQITLGHFFLLGKSCSSWCYGKFNLFLFYLYILFFT